MTIKDRKEREREEMRDLILNAADEIVKVDGINNLSIRKIASKIDYSPAIIYHYFSDKDDILHQVMRKGYQKIIDALSSVKVSAEHPEEMLRELTRNYINTALQMSDEYKSVQLSDSTEILEYTASLFKGASLKKPALGILFKCLKEIYRDSSIDDSTIELTAQIITTATFGLIIKLIIEKNINEEQRINLIEHHIKCIVDGMVLRNPMN